MKLKHFLGYSIFSFGIFLGLNGPAVNAAPTITTPTETERFVIPNGSSHASIQAAFDEAINNSTTEYTKVVFEAGSYSIEKPIYIYSNTIVEATGATITRNYSGNMKTGLILQNVATDGATAVDRIKATQTIGEYEVTKNIYIDGGTWSGGDLSQASAAGNNISIVHAENVIFQNATFTDNFGGHLVELNAVKNATVQNCTFNGYLASNRQVSGSNSNMALQLDIAHGGCNLTTGDHTECATHDSIPSGYLADDTACDGVKIIDNNFNTNKGTNNKYDYFGVSTGSDKTLAGDGIHQAFGQGIFHKNVTIMGNTVHHSFSEAIAARGIDTLKINDNKLYDGKGKGIAVKICKNSTVADNTIAYSKEIAIYVYNHSNLIAISNNTVQDTAQHGIGLEDHSTVQTIADNKILKTTNYGKGISLFKFCNAETIKNNTIYNTHASGIYLLTNSTATSIINNTITNSNQHGISLEDESTAFLISNNRIDTTTTGKGISLNKLSVATSITENELNNTAASSIFLYDQSSAATISNNKITDTKQHGISIESSKVTENIYSNEITTAAQKGISMHGNSDVSTIANNTIRSTTANSIFVMNSVAGAIKENKIDDSKQHGISIEGSDVANISNNTVFNITKNGIVVYNGANPSTISDITYNSLNNIDANAISIQGESRIKLLQGNTFEYVLGKTVTIAATAYVDVQEIIPTAYPTPTTAPTATVKPTAKPTITPAPTTKPTATPVSTKKPTSTPAPTKKPATTPVPTKKPVVTPAPTKKPVVTPAPTKKPAATPAPTKKPAVVKPSSVKLNVGNITLGCGEKFQLKATVGPNNAANKKVTYKSSKSSVATVSSKGLITPKKAGKTTITVTTWNGKYKKIQVTVKKAPTSIKFTKKSVTLKKGKSQKLSYKLSSGSTSRKITWSSTNSKVVTVDKNGKIVAKKKGTAYIQVKTFNKKTAKIKITVK